MEDDLSACEFFCFTLSFFRWVLRVDGEVEWFDVRWRCWAVWTL